MRLTRNQVVVVIFTPATSVILLGQPSLCPQEEIETVNITANPAAINTLVIERALNISYFITMKRIYVCIVHFVTGIPFNNVKMQKIF